MKTEVRFIVTGHVKSPQKLCLSVKWYKALRRAKAA